MGMKMEISGMGQILDALRGQVDKYKRAEKTALERAADVVAEEARRLVPTRTENLQESILITKVRTANDGASIVVGVDRSAAYAVPLEYGHINRDGSVTAPRSFMGAAYEAKKGEAYDVMRETIKEALTGR